MIEARKNPLLSRLVYALLVRPSLRGAFNRVRMRRGAPLPDAPVIWCANHSSWWDGYLVMAANELRFKRDAYVMVEAAQIARYGFFRWVGGFSVDRGDARSALDSLRYSADLLGAGTGRALLIFPQGTIAANDARPLSFFAGIGHIARNTARKTGVCAMVPLALRYEFIGEQKPEAFISAGPPMLVEASAQPKSVAAEAEAALTRELDQLRADVAAYRFDSFDDVLTGMPSINRIWDRMRGKAQIRRVGGGE